MAKNIEFERQYEFDREPGQIFVRTAWGIPVEQIKQLSAQNPDMTFYAKHSFEHDLYSNVYTLEYKNGEYQVIKVEPSYMMPALEEIKKKVPCYDELEEKLMSVFRRLDIETTDSEGNKALDCADAEVTVTVTHGDYKMRASKYYHQVDDIKVFKAKEIVSYQWEKVTVEEDPFGPAFSNEPL